VPGALFRLATSHATARPKWSHPRKLPLGVILRRFMLRAESFEPDVAQPVATRLRHFNNKPLPQALQICSTFLHDGENASRKMILGYFWTNCDLMHTHTCISSAAAPKFGPLDPCRCGHCPQGVATFWGFLALSELFTSTHLRPLCRGTLPYKREPKSSPPTSPTPLEGGFVGGYSARYMSNSMEPQPPSLLFCK